MKLFPSGHATHPQWRMAVGLVLAQLRAQMALPDCEAAPTLGLIYISDHYASNAQELLDHLSAELPEVTDWAGTAALGVLASGAEYIDEPALCVMLCALPTDQYRVFSGVAPLALAENEGRGGPNHRFRAHSALVHADAQTPDLPDLIAEVAGRTGTGYLFGGLSSSRTAGLQFAVGGNGNIAGQGAAGGVFTGGLSGVAFGPGVRLISRVTQGCQAISLGHQITAVEGPVVLGLNGESALDVLLRELGVSLDEPEQAIDAVRATLVGLSTPADESARPPGQAKAPFRRRDLGPEVRVRHIIGIDPARRGFAVAEATEVGMQLSFCRRSVQAARADLMRICAEIREELEPEEQPLALAQGTATGGAPSLPQRSSRMAGAVYVSCIGRGGPHFGAPSAEMQIVRHALGDVPLAGFFANGEIAHQHLYGYTGVLTVFVAEEGEAPN